MTGQSDADEAGAAAPGVRLKRRTEPHRFTIGGAKFAVAPFGSLEKEMAEELARKWARELVDSFDLMRELNVPKGVTARLMEASEGLELSAGFGQFLYATALATIIVEDLSGVVMGEDDAPAAPSRNTFALLFQEVVPLDVAARTYGELFIEKTAGLRLLETGEGKPFAGGRNDISAPPAKPAGDA